MLWYWALYYGHYNSLFYQTISGILQLLLLRECHHRILVKIFSRSFNLLPMTLTSLRYNSTKFKLTAVAICSKHLRISSWKTSTWLRMAMMTSWKQKLAALAPAQGGDELDLIMLSEDNLWLMNAFHYIMIFRHSEKTFVILRRKSQQPFWGFRHLNVFSHTLKLVSV